MELWELNKIEDMTVKGHNGVIKFYKDKLIIERKGVLSFFTHGLAGDKIIYLTDISSIQFKNAGVFTNGYIQFSFYGGIESKKGLFDATKDENTVIFTAKQEKEFAILKYRLDKVLLNLKLKKNGVKNVEKKEEKEKLIKNENNYLDELERLGELKNKGILTEEEFVQKKKQLLGI